MASIDRRPNGKYRARWRDYPTGPQKVRHFERKADRDAQRFLDAVKGDIVRGTYISPTGGSVKFRDYAEEWRAGQVHRSGTASQIESYLRVHAYPTFGDRPLGSIRRLDIQTWVKGRSEVLAPGSVELVYRWVATVFKAAVADRLIPSSPCISIKLRSRTRGEVVPLEPAEVQAIADAIPPRYRALVLFAAGTGMNRPGSDGGSGYWIPTNPGRFSQSQAAALAGCRFTSSASRDLALLGLVRRRVTQHRPECSGWTGAGEEVSLGGVASE